MIVVVDYGAGNIHSVARALARVGATFVVTGEATTISNAGSIVLPGVGAAADTMRSLRKGHVVDPVVAAIARGVPYLGICMGLQVLFERSEEDDGTQCLGVLPGTVVRFPTNLTVPHMGWNQVHQTTPTQLMDGISQDTNFYFVHSYYSIPTVDDHIVATTDYGSPFVSAVQRDNIFATQFHPEKSGDAGLRLYANFVRFSGQHTSPEFD